jgi:hypothetical protein
MTQLASPPRQRRVTPPISAKKVQKKIAIYAHKVAKVFGDGNWKLNIPEKNQFLGCVQPCQPVSALP